MQTLLDAHTIQDQTQRCRYQRGYHGRQSHFGLADSPIPPCEVVRHDIAKLAASWNADNGPETSGDEAKANLPGLKAIGARECRVDIGSDSHQESDRDRLHERGPKHGREADEDQRAQENLVDGFAGEDAVEDA